MFRKIILGLVVVLVISQFIRPARNDGQADGPADITHAVSVPDDVMAVLRESCYDCHSNHTRYPWYSRITPVNWWLRNHITDGKKELNFSTFASYDEKKQVKKLEETAEMVQEGEMPLPSFTVIHRDARLSDQQRRVLTDWVKSVSSVKDDD